MNERLRQFKRTFAVIGLLRRRWWTAKDLASKLGVSAKTIKRDVRALEELSVPVMEDVDHDGLVPALRFRIDSKWRPW